MGQLHFNPAIEKVVPKDTVVLDLNEIGGHLPAAKRLEYILDALRSDEPASDRISNRRIAEVIEAQVKPPRIPEPGVWGVVEAGCAHDPRRRRKYIHHERSGGTPGYYVWANVTSGVFVHWLDLIDPVLVRPGLDD